MKKIVLFLALIGTGSTALASETSDYELAQAYCKSAETIASFAQGYRQLGKKASDATEKLLAISSKLNNAEARESSEAQIFMTVRHAYQIPIYTTSEMKKQAVQEFSETNYLICIDSFEKAIEENKDK